MPARIGATAGKKPGGQNKTQLTGSKYEAGGAKARRKKGGIIRKPLATISPSRRGKKSA